MPGCGYWFEDEDGRQIRAEDVEFIPVPKAMPEWMVEYLRTLECP